MTVLVCLRIYQASFMHLSVCIMKKMYDNLKYCLWCSHSRRYSPTVLSTATHCLLLLWVRYRLIHTSPRSNNKKYLLAKESCQTRIDLTGGSLFAEFVGPEDDCFMGTISLKDLVFIPLLNTLKLTFYRIFTTESFVHGLDVLTWTGAFSPSNQTTMDSSSWSVKCLFWSTYPHLVVVYD